MTDRWCIEGFKKGTKAYENFSEDIDEAVVEGRFASRAYDCDTVLIRRVSFNDLFNQIMKDFSDAKV